MTDDETPVLCSCGRPARGPVPADDVAIEHTCRQCSPDHCRIRGHVLECRDRGETGSLDVRWVST